MSGKHKRVRHYHEPGDLHELTFSCYQQRPLLNAAAAKQYLTDAINAAAAKFQFRLVAFVYMPEHIHLLVYPEAEPEVSRLLAAIKRPVSVRVKQDLQATHNPLLEELTVRERRGKRVFRFWQEGPGYDRNLQTPAAVEAAIDYIHLNPVRRGLCEQARDWLWSSARWYETDDLIDDQRIPQIQGPPPGTFD